VKRFLNGNGVLERRFYREAEDQDQVQDQEQARRFVKSGALTRVTVCSIAAAATGFCLPPPLFLQVRKR